MLKIPNLILSSTCTQYWWISKDIYRNSVPPRLWQRPLRSLMIWPPLYGWNIADTAYNTDPINHLTDCSSMQCKDGRKDLCTLLSFLLKKELNFLESTQLPPSKLKNDQFIQVHIWPISIVVTVTGYTSMLTFTVKQRVRIEDGECLAREHLLWCLCIHY